MTIDQLQNFYLLTDLQKNSLCEKNRLHNHVYQVCLVSPTVIKKVVGRFVDPFFFELRDKIGSTVMSAHYRNETVSVYDDCKNEEERDRVKIEHIRKAHELWENYYELLPDEVKEAVCEFAVPPCTKLPAEADNTTELTDLL
jgi:hypothetical protein